MSLQKLVSIAEKNAKDTFQSHKKISIHPGIVVGDPHPETGAHPVAMISKKPPFNPPQAPIEHFQTGTGIYGNVVLKARPISPSAMKPWKDASSGGKQTPLAGQGYQKLIKAMGMCMFRNYDSDMV